MGIEIVTHNGADGEDRRDHDPIHGMRKRHWIVIGNHQEQDGQCQVIVMRRSELGDHSKFRVWRFALLEVCDDNFLVGNDDEKHVARHDGADHCADMEKHRAGTEQLAEPDSSADDQHK